MKVFGGRREGKTFIAVEASRSAQKRGLRVLWAMHDQTSTAILLSKHGALSEVIGKHYLAPHFREP